MPLKHRPELPHPVLKPRSPAAWRLVPMGWMSESDVQHERDQFRFARDIAIERHRRNTALLSDSLHRDGLQPFGVRDGYPGLRDLFHAEAGFRSTGGRSALAPEQLNRAPVVVRRLVMGHNSALLFFRA